MATFNRRQVLQSTAASAAAAATATSVFGAAPASAAPATTKAVRTLLGRSRFTAVLGSTFTMKSPITTWQARLEVIGDLLPVLAPADENRFSLLFSTTQPGPPQGTFTFTRPGFEATQLFVIPDGDRRRYLAIINRL